MHQAHRWVGGGSPGQSPTCYHADLAELLAVPARLARRSTKARPTRSQAPSALLLLPPGCAVQATPTCPPAPSAGRR